MTFDPPERKAEGESGPFSHVIATRIYVRVTRFYVKAALKHGIVMLGTQSDHGELSGKKTRSLLKTLELEESSGPARSTISRNYHREPELQWELER